MMQMAMCFARQLLVVADQSNNAYIASGSNANPFIVGTDTLALTGGGDVFVAKYSCNGDFSTAINKQSNEESTSIFPNPSSGIFMLNFKNKTVGTKICVYDVLGNCLQNNVCQNDVRPIIDISSQPKGIYFLEIISDSVRVMKKIILQ